MKYDRKDNIGHNKAHSKIQQLLAFYQKYEIDTEYKMNLLLEYCKLLMHEGNASAAIRANEQIKKIMYDFETEHINIANSNIRTIHRILYRKNDLEFLLNNLNDSNFFDWIEKYNSDILKHVLYDDYWSIENEENVVPPPIQFIEHSIEWVLRVVYDLLFVFKKLAKIDLIKLLKGIHKWNDPEYETKETEQDDDDDDKDKDTKLMRLTSKMSKKEAAVLIDFLHVKYIYIWFVLLCVKNDDILIIFSLVQWHIVTDHLHNIEIQNGHWRKLLN